jgi:hypothetical protein
MHASIVFLPAKFIPRQKPANPAGQSRRNTRDLETPVEAIEKNLIDNWGEARLRLVSRD